VSQNQRVHGSSPCAPTIEIKDLGVELNIKSEPETSSGQRSGQHSADFVADQPGPPLSRQKRPLAPTAPRIGNAWEVAMAETAKAAPVVHIGEAV
jgi:hypothetical protein